MLIVGLLPPPKSRRRRHRRHRRCCSSSSLFVVVVVRRHRCSSSSLFVVLVVRRRHRSSSSSFDVVVIVRLGVFVPRFPPLPSPLCSTPLCSSNSSCPGSAGHGGEVDAETSGRRWRNWRCRRGPTSHACGSTCRPPFRL